VVRGKGREITDRSGLKFRNRYRDLFETTLGFAPSTWKPWTANSQAVKRDGEHPLPGVGVEAPELILHRRAAVVDGHRRTHFRSPGNSVAQDYLPQHGQTDFLNEAVRAPLLTKGAPQQHLRSLRNLHIAIY
jgi:hypothetical protein